MVISESKLNGYMNRLITSRTRILCKQGFYGLLLMHMKFALDDTIDTAATDGEKTYFSPQFLDELTDSELDFVLLHEVIHVTLQHCARYEKRNRFLFNVACDIVVNSNILYANDMDEKSIRLSKYGVAMHIAPNGKEGYLYTAEEVYEMLLSNKKETEANSSWDNHEKWGKYGPTSSVYESWVKHFKDACVTFGNRKAFTNSGMPLFAERIIAELNKPQVDWRTLLNDFVQEDINDYTFSPPDKRFSSGPFLLPDYNERVDTVKEIFFFVDTSGSISIKELTAAYSEIKGAIEQFTALHGKLAFFDFNVKEPIYDFEDTDSLLKIKPLGGGGTSFYSIFEYVAKNLADNPPATIVILTDGEAAYPPEEKALGIPVLWLINNEENTPPWGKIARIKIEK